MKRKEIALTKETRRARCVPKIMETIAPYLGLRSSDRVAIKINLSGSREIYANTSYAAVESLIFFLKEQFGICEIAVIEGSDGAFFSNRSTWDIFYKFRYKEVELNGARLVNLDELEHDESLTVQTLSGERPVHFARFEADYLISVVPPKTHNIFPVSLAIPNLVGFVRPEERVLMFGASRTEMRRLSFSGNQRYFQLIDNAGRNFAALLGKISPDLVLIDGLYGMEGKGPIKGSPVFHGFAVASEDPVQADAMATYVMGINVNDVSYLKYAAEAGLGNLCWQNVIGVDPAQVKFPYRPHPLHPRQRCWLKHTEKSVNGAARLNDTPNPSGSRSSRRRHEHGQS
ncbi:MAG: DUF362 domain-containing protein [Candidatus Aminicenantes bacterium]|nr:DUF362 domain-containing protein [Candidatus Aminicenantes bacterium]